MKILSIDTASDVCGVSILEDKKSIVSLDTNTGRTHSENLMPMIENAFNQTNLSLNDIELITCDIGPGCIIRKEKWNFRNSYRTSSRKC